MFREIGGSPVKNPNKDETVPSVPLFRGPTDRIDHEHRMFRRDISDRLSFAVRGAIGLAVLAGAIALIGCGESEKRSSRCAEDSARDGDGIYSIKHRLFPNIDAVSAKAVKVFVEGAPFADGSVPLGDRVTVCVDTEVADLAAGKNVPEGID